MPHSIYDTDKHFVINPITREIVSESNKILLIQHDHNSERITFELPRLIDGHDMSLCNLVQVHYLNYDSRTGNSFGGLYKVDDLQLDPENSDIVTCSWLISDNATKNVGALNFMLRFACVDNNHMVEYDWHTSIYKNLSIGQGIDNAEEIINRNADILSQWEASLMEIKRDQIKDILDDLLGEVENGTY